MNKIILTLAFINLSFLCSSQGVSYFLQEVMENHPGIRAEKELLITREAESFTGYTPPDPRVSFGYFPGRPETIGDKVTWSVTQSFDFPSRYNRLKNINEINQEQAVMEYRYKILSYLSDARGKVIELVAIEKYLERLRRRQIHIMEMKDAYENMLREGEATIIDFNKINVTAAGIESQIIEYNNLKNEMTRYLDILSGNNTAMLESAGFPVFEEPEFDELLEEKKAMHPAFMIPRKEIEVAEGRIMLAKSESLPKLEFGMASEIVADTRFTGPTLGFSIPIWENKGRVQAAMANKSQYEAKQTNEIIIMENELRSIYSRFLSVKDGLETLKNSYDMQTTLSLLDTSLEEGEITVIDYFTELKSYYDVEDRIAELEKEYYLLLSSLYDHFPGFNIPYN